MKKQLLGGALVLSACTAVQTTAAESFDDRYRYDDSETDRFSLRIGTFSLRDSNATVRIDSSRGPIGTVIDFEETLDVQNTTDAARLDAYYRFNPRHRLDFSHYRIERDGTTTLLEDIDFGDREFEAGRQVNTVHNSTITKLSYSYSFIHVRQFEFSIGAGLHVSKIELAIDAPDADLQESADGTAPLPVFNFRGRYDLTPKWSLRGKFEAFFLEFDDYKGAFTDSLFTIEHQTFKNVGFGLGLNRLNMEVTAKDGDLRGEIESSNNGVLLFAKVGW